MSHDDAMPHVPVRHTTRSPSDVALHGRGLSVPSGAHPWRRRMGNHAAGCCRGIGRRKARDRMAVGIEGGVMTDVVALEAALAVWYDTGDGRALACEVTRMLERIRMRRAGRRYGSGLGGQR